MSLYAIDFFCGAGGLTRGLLDAGINVIAGLDNSILCKETYEANNSPSRFIQCDIRDFPNDLLSNLLDDVRNDDLLFAACAPCQPFARLNKTGRNEDAKLLSSFAYYIEQFMPNYVFIENVDGLKKVKGNSTYKRFLSKLNRLGYTFIELVVNAKDYGVPQSRRRLIILASRGKEPIPPIKTHGKGLIPYVTVKDVISAYPKINAGDENGTIPNHKALRLEALNLRRIKATPHDGGGWRDWPKEIWLNCHKKDQTGHTDVYGRMNWDQPSPTLTCKCCSISNGRYGHPEQDRAISFREAAKLQSFPDHYIFYASSNKELGKQIGNAVPVQLAKAIGEAFNSIYHQEVN